MSNHKYRAIPLMLISALAMTGCGLVHPKSPTKSVAPTVICQSGRKDASLPAYPKPPKTETKQSLHSFAKAQESWAIQAIGAFSVEKAERANTRKCLKNLRKQGIIN